MFLCLFYVYAYVYVLLLSWVKGIMHLLKNQISIISCASLLEFIYLPGP
jgi:hypothetical protein